MFRATNIVEHIESKESNLDMVLCTWLDDNIYTSLDIWKVFPEYF